MQLFQKQTSESSAVQHNSIYKNAQETFVEEPPHQELHSSQCTLVNKNASREANSYLGNYTNKKQANHNSLTTTSVRKQAENKSANTIPLLNGSSVDRYLVG